MEHIKRCYLIPVAVSIALLYLHSLVEIFLFRFRGGFIGALFSTTVEFAVIMAALVSFCIGIADSIFAVINRRTVTSTVLGIVFLVFTYFTVLELSGLFEFVLMLSFVGTTGAISAFFNGRTATAIVSGTAVLVFALTITYFAFGRGIDFGYFDRLVITIYFTGSSLLVGGGILTVAFITHTNTALSKLKILYLILPILLIPVQLYELLFVLFGHGPFGLPLVRQTLLSQLLQGLIAGGCIMMGINEVIYSKNPYSVTSK